MKPWNIRVPYKLMTLENNQTLENNDTLQTNDPGK